MGTGATGCWFGGPHRPSWFRAPRLARPPTDKRMKLLALVGVSMCWWSGNKNIPDASADPHALLPHPGGDGAGRGVLIAAYNVPRTLVAGRKRGSVTRAKCRCSPCCWLQLQSDSFLTHFRVHTNAPAFPPAFCQTFRPNSTLFELQYTHVVKFSNFSTPMLGTFTPIFELQYTLFPSNRGGEGGLVLELGVGFSNPNLWLGASNSTVFVLF